MTTAEVDANSTTTSLLEYVERLEADNAALGEDLQQVHVLHSAAVALEQNMAELAAENDFLRQQLYSLTKAAEFPEHGHTLVVQALQTAEDFGYQRARAETSAAQQKILELEEHLTHLQNQQRHLPEK